MHGTTGQILLLTDTALCIYSLFRRPSNLHLHGQMASRWARAAVLGRDPRVAPSVGIDMCSHAAWVLKFQEGGCTVPKHLKLGVLFAVLQCLARPRLGWHQLRVRTDRLKKADARLPRNQRLCWLCSTDGAPFLAQRVAVGVVLKMSSISYWNIQPTSIYVRDTCVFLATPCLMVQPRVSSCNCLPSLIVISRTSWHTLSTQ
jgi:hypothetical protein